MGVKGVLIATGQTGRMWVGPLPAWRLVLDNMREIRELSGTVLCNFTGRPFDAGGRVDVIDMPPAAEPIDQIGVYDEIAKLGLGPSLLCCHTCTPLVPLSAMEKCVAAVLGYDGRDSAQTVVETNVALHGTDGWSVRLGYVPVLGVRSFRAQTLKTADWHKFGSGSNGKFQPVMISRKQSLSLMDEGDHEMISALEHHGSI